MTLLIMAICTGLFEKLYTILRLKGPRRPDITNFSFKMFKVMRSLRSSKCLKTTVGLTFTTKTQALLVLGQLVLFSTGNTFFWINLVQKLKIISLSSNFVPRLIQICTIPWWCSLLLFSAGNTFLGRFDAIYQKLSV